MELENQTLKHTYIKLLCDALQRKYEVLQQLMRLTEKQEEIISSEAFDEDSFLDIIDQKEEQLQTLNSLDSGFTKLYESVKEELVVGKLNYSVEISCMKELITKITDLSVRLQAIEKRNKEKFEAVIASKRIEIKKLRISNQTATNYYKTMAQQHESQSYFYDKKN